MPESTGEARRPVVLRGGTVLTLDAAHTVLTGGDVLVVDDRIAAVGTDLAVPEGTDEIDARGGIVMPGMIDTHRHSGRPRCAGTAPTGRSRSTSSGTTRAHGLPVLLSMDTTVWWSGGLFSAMRTTLGADRSREHLEAHAKGETVTHAGLRAEQVVDWATQGGAHAPGREDLGSLEVGKKADVVLIRNEHSPAMTPLLHPYGHVAFQAQRGDVEAVIVDGRVIKRDHRLVGADLAAARRTVEAAVEHLRATLGEEAWAQGMNPEVPTTKVLDNPYTCTDYRSASTHQAGASGS